MRTELSTQYPAMVVKAGDSLAFDLDIDNQSGMTQDVTLSVESIPEGWTGSFSAAGKQRSALCMLRAAQATPALILPWIFPWKSRTATIPWR